MKLHSEDIFRAIFTCQFETKYFLAMSLCTFADLTLLQFILGQWLNCTEGGYTHYAIHEEAYRNKKYFFQSNSPIRHNKYLFGCGHLPQQKKSSYLLHGIMP